MERICVIGANGQIGSELVEALTARYGAENVIAADSGPRSLYGAARYETVDVLDRRRVEQVIDSYGVTQVYQLAALLSASGEQAPLQAWTLNMDGLLNILELARERGRVTIAEAAKATGASRNTVKDHVRTLTDRKHLTRHGAGRGAWYGPG